MAGPQSQVLFARPGWCKSGVLNCPDYNMHKPRPQLLIRGGLCVRLPQQTLLSRATSPTVTARSRVQGIYTVYTVLHFYFAYRILNIRDMSPPGNLRLAAGLPSLLGSPHEHCKVAEDFEISHGVSFAAD